MVGVIIVFGHGHEKSKTMVDFQHWLSLLQLLPPPPPQATTCLLQRLLQLGAWWA